YWAAPLSAKLPMVTSVLDLIPLLYPAYAVGFLNRLYVSLVSASARGSNHIITISHTSALDIENHLDIPRENISVTYLAPDMRFHPRMGAERDAAVREKYDLPEQFVLYLGSYDMRKQVNRLMLAYTYVGEAEGDNIPLVLAGKPPAQWEEPLYPDLEEYARRLNITDYVQWLGYVDEEDKPALYRLADVFVFPSEYEGFGLPPLEAMASGTPAVTSDAVIFDEVLEDAAYLTENSREMAGAIIALLLQQPLRDAMINQGLAHATKYNWRKTAKATLEVYEKILDKV
ncbi:MAG: glycosyltransferase family 4 protein, partial [Aggregatilineales bacterium]